MQKGPAMKYWMDHAAFLVPNTITVFNHDNETFNN